MFPTEPQSFNIQFFFKMKLSRLSLLLVACTVVSVGSAIAQAPAPAARSEAASGKNLLMKLKEGGWVMWPIGLCSMFTLYLIGDGVSRTSRARIAPEKHVAALKDLFRSGDYVGAYAYCKANPSPLTNVLRTGISMAGEGKDVSEIAMQEELGKENSEIQTRISYLSVIGVCAPMIGLLGTVTGMITAFATLGSDGIGDPGKLAGAIGEVLIATASGLFVAIPAFIAFYFLRNRSASALHAIQDAINNLFRRMPWQSLAHAHIGDDELYAAEPNWLHPGGGDHPDISSAQPA